MRGCIYGIFNKCDKICYIGSTMQDIPKKRLVRHVRDNRHGKDYSGLFGKCKDDYVFKIISEEDYDWKYQLKEVENKFITHWWNEEGWNCVNKILAYIPEELRSTSQKIASQKYLKTDKGKEARKWQNHRYNSRKKINNLILSRVQLIN